MLSHYTSPKDYYDTVDGHAIDTDGGALVLTEGNYFVRHSQYHPIQRTHRPTRNLSSNPIPMPLLDQNTLFKPWPMQPFVQTTSAVIASGIVSSLLA